MLGYNILAESVKMSLDKNRVTLTAFDESLELIGKGRSAYVFRIRKTDKALKVFFPHHTNVAREEAEIYKMLQDISYYPTLYDSGRNYLVIDFIEGQTLFECLVNGTHVSQDQIKEIDHALHLARQKGLNPSDIHLRNIFITSEQEIKVIDVARFRQTKQCRQWKDLKSAFYKAYVKPFFPKKIPASVLNLIAALYKKSLNPNVALGDSK
ncbi:protein kinase family protein [Peribacillus glennii]|uniref:Protein kinase family protein n=1 Tax=Peribacillus glennii TaxID=2303991 RepID=A0A372LB63_9BACI|nr:protein kinase family protein [Peribacillus glennii]RFU62975.1 protein kinase family protein [Peribacillus glennii]